MKRDPLKTFLKYVDPRSSEKFAYILWDLQQPYRLITLAYINTGCKDLLLMKQKSKSTKICRTNTMSYFFLQQRFFIIS